MEALPAISKEFLEENIGRKVESFTVKPGTNVGDNYMSVLYSIDVEVQKEEDNNNETETLHLLSKCYPSHPARQEFLNKSNIFWNELSIYKILLPELHELSKQIGMGDRKLFPPLIGGKAVNFEKMRQLDDTSYEGKIFGPFEIYIMMTDLRKTWGFRMADRQAGLTFDEVRLVISAQARLHALSWGYKKLNGLDSLSEKFDFLDFRLTDEDLELWVKLMGDSVIQAAETIDKVLGKNSPIAEQTRKLREYAGLLVDIAYTKKAPEARFSEAHRCKPNDVPSEEPWRILLHGDCWTNNLLFRYNEETSKPEEVVLVDLQIMREHCLTLDLVYLFYCSTTTEFRKEYLNQVIEIYYEQFTACCDLMGVPALPNFSLEELTRRFHRSKIFGFFLATMALPIMTKDAKDIVDLETVSGQDMTDILQTMTEHQGNNQIYTKRIVSLAQELYDEGVL